MLFFQSLLWKLSFEALLQTTQYPLPASAGIWADGFWQIVSIKETNNLSTAFQGRVFIPRLFFIAVNGAAWNQARPFIVLFLSGRAPWKSAGPDTLVQVSMGGWGPRRKSCLRQPLKIVPFSFH
jgi:hypothetical protein